MRLSRFLIGCGALAVTVSSLGTAPEARADFPNLDGFTAVPPENYFVTTERASVRSIHFSTPDGIGCMFRASENITPTSRQRLTCDGNVPGIPADAQAAPNVPGIGGPIGCPIGTVAQKGDGPFEISRGSWSCGTKPDAPELGVGQKITYGNVTCAVGDGNVTACEVAMGDQKHGFVLQPSGSTAF